MAERYDEHGFPDPSGRLAHIHKFHSSVVAMRRADWEEAGGADQADV